MKSTIVKHSIVLMGYKTSVSLEAEFWDGLREIASTQKIKPTELLQQIDKDRKGGNLSSAIRVFVLNYLRAQPTVINDRRGEIEGPHSGGAIRSITKSSVDKTPP
jgi:predicted DNA-binding ribbon-helix-helix protein